MLGALAMWATDWLRRRTAANAGWLFRSGGSEVQDKGWATSHPRWLYLQQDFLHTEQLDSEHLGGIPVGEPDTTDQLAVKMVTPPIPQQTAILVFPNRSSNPRNRTFHPPGQHTACKQLISTARLQGLNSTQSLFKPSLAAEREARLHSCCLHGKTFSSLLLGQEGCQC